MSTVICSSGSARSSSHVQRRGSSISPTIEKSHRSSGVCGVGPAESTGKSEVTYCPGGTRAESASSRRRPRNPRETNDITARLSARGACAHCGAPPSFDVDEVVNHGLFVLAQPRRAGRTRDKEPQMPELIADFITSLDGYGAADGWPGWWGLEGPEYLAWLGDRPEADSTILMGANTYRLMSGLATDGEPGTDALAGMPKIVFSSTLTEPLSWANTRLVSRDAVDAVRRLKDEGTESMSTLGSLALCRSLLGAGLVDRFRVVVFPVITGSTGRDRIYDGYPDVSLELVSSRTFDGRLQLLEYVPTVLAGPPEAGKNDV